MARIKSRQVNHLSFARTKAGCIWRWSSTCVRIPVNVVKDDSIACSAMHCRWRCGGVNIRKCHCSHGSWQAIDYQALLKHHLLRESMSAKGCCYGNACVENFFHSLKMECMHGERFGSREIMRTTAFNYIECDYNRWRRHSACGDLNSEQFENQELA